MPDAVTTKYPFILAAEVTRKEGTTREEFRNHYETIYAPLVKKLTGKGHPLTWTRRYHVEEGEGPIGVPRLVVGNDDGMNWDCFTEMTFADELHCQQFIALMHSDEAEPIIEEEAKFADPEKTKMIVMRRDVTVNESACAKS